MSTNKYLNKLSVINILLNSQKENTTENDLLFPVYSNYFGLVSNLIDEIISDNSLSGNRISTLASIINDCTVTASLKLIIKNYKNDAFSNVNIKEFNSKIFLSMLDAYILSERDSESLKNLMGMMKKNMFLAKINNKEFILNYPDIIKNIYIDNLEPAVRSICEVISSSANVEINYILATLLTYLSASLELPDVYVYSKKISLELTMLKHDYKIAAEIIKDLEDMHYHNSDMQYYKAVIRQRKKESFGSPFTII